MLMLEGEIRLGVFVVPARKKRSPTHFNLTHLGHEIPCVRVLHLAQASGRKQGLNDSLSRSFFAALVTQEPGVRNDYFIGDSNHKNTNNL